jgi:hypothetical protein
MNVILSDKEFKKMVQELQKLRDEKEELLKANKFLNEQIREYNERYANENKSNHTRK